MNGLALCAGVGGLERGIESVLPDYRTVCYVEGEAYVSACLVAQMAKGLVDEAPIWSNVRTFDGKPWRGKVDLISAGFPCQPYSKAGKQKGTEDPRHLWPSISRIIGEVRPSIVVLENVPNVVDFAGPIVFGDLAKMGFDAAWGIVRASDAGAPHQRARFFAVAIHPDTDHHGLTISRLREDDHEGVIGKGELARNRAEGLRPDVPDTNGEGRQGHWFSLEREAEEIPHGHFRQESQPRAWTRPGWTPEPRVDRMVDGVANWMDRLRACGNGVVPQQAELAIRILMNTLIQNQSEVKN